jgi:hypothetical protein
LNFINAGTLGHIFGFGVDYGFYIMQSYLREEVRDVNNALRLSGENVMIWAATTNTDEMIRDSGVSTSFFIIYMQDIHAGISG